MRRSDLCPLGSCTIPKPSISQIISAVESTEEHYFLCNSVISDLGVSTRRRREKGGHLRPGNSVECPRVVQIRRAVEPAEHNYFSAGGVVSHLQARASRRRKWRAKLDPAGGVRTSGRRA